MSTKQLSSRPIGGLSIALGALALLAAVAITAPSSAAHAATVDAQVGQHGIMMAIDIGAARRQRPVQRHSSPRNGYGSYVGGEGSFATQSRPAPAYGYGVGDNSRNQTW